MIGRDGTKLAMATKEEITEALKQVYDPELNINVVDLGLVYGTELDDQGNVKITMTLTSPGCPIGPMVGEMVQDALGPLEGIGTVDVDIVWTPPWHPGKMSEEAKMELGFGGL
ncbi:MAG TPA: iron-sulfur cluster assembly protein [Chloroflexota bacterium]|nr:iron-sulfur cluster assembly protein [Chloroflexota bacterium]